jgi:hypothetical protein
MKKLKVWMVVFGAVVFAGGASALVPAHQGGARARAQDAPTLTQAELLTVSLLQSILVELVKLNDNVDRLPATAE